MPRTAVRAPNNRWFSSFAWLTVIVLALSACGSAGGGGDEAAADADGIVRLVLAPDPVWKWMEDEGIRAEMEEAAGIQILSSSSWDEFGVYAGGHADVVSAASYEVPDLEEATGIDSTIFGAYNADRSILAVPTGSDAKDICDLEGKRIVTLSAVSITIMWGVYAKEFCGLDLQAGGGDFDVIVADIQNLASLVEGGDADACLCLPDFAIPQLSSGSLTPLYDSDSAAQIFAEEFGDPNDIDHPQTNVFVAPNAWVEKNPEEAAFLIEVWDRGLQEWREHREEIIAAYPEDFAAETEEEKAFILDWLDTKYDWFVETAYLTQDFIDGEQAVFDLMQSSGYLSEDVEAPDYTIIEP